MFSASKFANKLVQLLYQDVLNYKSSADVGSHRLLAECEAISLNEHHHCCHPRRFRLRDLLLVLFVWKSWKNTYYCWSDGRDLWPLSVRPDIRKAPQGICSDGNTHTGLRWPLVVSVDPSDLQEGGQGLHANNPCSLLFFYICVIHSSSLSLPLSSSPPLVSPASPQFSAYPSSSSSSPWTLLHAVFQYLGQGCAPALQSGRALRVFLAA